MPCHAVPMPTPLLLLPCVWAHGTFHRGVQPCPRKRNVVVDVRLMSLLLYLACPVFFPIHPFSIFFACSLPSFPFSPSMPVVLFPTSEQPNEKGFIPMSGWMKGAYSPYPFCSLFVVCFCCLFVLFSCSCSPSECMDDRSHLFPLLFHSLPDWQTDTIHDTLSVLFNSYFPDTDTSSYMMPYPLSL